MKIAIGQINPTVGSLRANAQIVLQQAALARSEGARLVVFPELCLTGYPPRDLLNVSGFVREADQVLDQLVRDAPEGIALAVGTVRPSRTANLLSNTAVVLERGTILREVAKSLLPTYDVFDERRYFEPADRDCERVVDIAGTRIGLTICEDMWNDRLLWGGQRRYNRDPVAECVEQGADILVNLSASPFAIGKEGLRARLVSHAATRWKRPVVYAAAVGGNDGLIFDGGSLAARADGAFVDVSPLFESSLRTFDPEGPAIDRSPISPMEELCGALTLGLSDYARKTGLTGAMVGLSGGIDSALVASLARLAFGASNVLGVAMPSRHSSDHSVNDARELAQRLGIQFMIVPIETAHAAYESMLSPVLAGLGSAPEGDVTFENVQARIRGAILMALSNRTGRLLLTTGNKSECSVGYCTLYGDTCGGLAVIADLWKLQVYELSRWLNTHKLDGAIPQSSLTKPPSAELRPDQRDDQSLPPYEVLDPILQQLVEQEASIDEAAAATGEPAELVRQIALKLYRAEYKRKQFAPTLRVTSRSWGGRDYPIAQGWL
ncbi:MAG: NAD+ synthase [Deltaproteobacteria bacterium]|nr:NAD+ synthase [Deltaproteobacteria bacterium]